MWPTRWSSIFAALARARGSRLRVIGNLPYNISTPLLFHIAAAHEHIDDLHVMLQKEVIDRIAAAPGSGVVRTAHRDARRPGSRRGTCSTSARAPSARRRACGPPWRA